MMNPLAPRLALLFAEKGLEQEMCLSLAAKALLPSAEEFAEEIPHLLAEEGVDSETCLGLAAEATHSGCPTSLPRSYRMRFSARYLAVPALSAPSSRSGRSPREMRSWE